MNVEFLNALNFPLANKIHTNPSIAGALVYKELHVEYDLDQYLDSDAWVTPADKALYIIQGKRFPAYAIDNLHETNMRLDSLGRYSPTTERAIDFLESIQHHFKEGRNDLAWLKANHAARTCRFTSEISRNLAKSDNSIEAKAALFTSLIYTESNELVAYAGLKVLVMKSKNRVILSRIEGLIDRLVQRFCELNYWSSSDDLLPVLEWMLVESDIRIKLADNIKFLNRIGHILHLDWDVPNNEKKRIWSILKRLATNQTSLKALRKHDRLIKQLEESLPLLTKDSSKEGQRLVENVRYCLSKLNESVK